MANCEMPGKMYIQCCYVSAAPNQDLNDYHGANVFAIHIPNEDYHDEMYCTSNFIFFNRIIIIFKTKQNYQQL